MPDPGPQAAVGVLAVRYALPLLHRLPLGKGMTLEAGGGIRLVACECIAEEAGPEWVYDGRGQLCNSWLVS